MLFFSQKVCGFKIKHYLCITEVRDKPTHYKTILMYDLFKSIQTKTEELSNECAKYIETFVEKYPNLTNFEEIGWDAHMDNDDCELIISLSKDKVTYHNDWDTEVLECYYSDMPFDNLVWLVKSIDSLLLYKKISENK